MSKNTSLQDQPIHRDGANITQKDVLKEDSLNNKPYARALAEFIESTDTPMTIGLQGDWGIGKTSMMNMIKGCLTNTYCMQIDFNTWSYSQFKQDEYLALACLEALIGKVESKMSKKEVLKMLKAKFAKKISVSYNEEDKPSPYNSIKFDLPLINEEIP